MVFVWLIFFFFFLLADFVLTGFVVGRDRFLPVLEEDEEEDDVDVVAAFFLDALVVTFVVVFDFDLAVALDVFVRFLPVLEEDEVDVDAADFFDALVVAFVVVFALALALDTIPTMPNPFVDCEDIFTLDSTPSSVKTTLILEYIVL